MLFALDTPRSKWISQMLVFLDYSGGYPLHTHGQAGQIFPGVLGVTGNTFRQLRHTNSSKLLRLGLVVDPLTMQSNFDCCAAAHGYLPQDKDQGYSITGELRQSDLSHASVRTITISFSDLPHGGPPWMHAVLFSPSRTAALFMLPT